MQLGRVRNNPADYLACVVSRIDGKVICLDLNTEMSHINRDLQLESSDDI